MPLCNGQSVNEVLSCLADYDSMVSGPIDHSEGWHWGGNIDFDIYVVHVSFNVGNIGTGKVYSFLMSRFQLYRADGGTRIYRRAGERTALCCVRETVPFGGGSVIVWDGICGQQRTDLIVIDGTLAAHLYINHFLPWPVIDRTCVGSSWPANSTSS